MATSRRVVSSVALALALNVAAAPAFAHEGDTLAPAPVAAPPPAPLTPVGPAEVKRNSPWPWALIGAGALTLGTGIWLVHRDNSDANMPACTTSPVNSRATCPYSTATQWPGWAVVAIGAQLAIAGVAWRIYEVRHSPKKTVTVVLAPGGLAGTF
jgi:hypothetical protein